MSEVFVCSAAVLVFAAAWLAVYKLGGLDWMADASLASAHLQLSAANLALDGEMHGAAARLSPVVVASSGNSVPSRPLFDALAAQAHHSMPVTGLNA
ncbi:MAG: hypothetical protein JWN73_3552 [Betaproteobacteria bacterium]|nr:hypothetical protein [Betaproteobacteria bacterium]